MVTDTKSEDVQKIEVRGLTELELRELQADLGQAAVEQIPSGSGKAAHNEMSVFALIAISAIAAKAITTIWLRRTSTHNRVIELVRKSNDGEVRFTIRDTKYSSEPPEEAVLRAVADAFSMNFEDLSLLIKSSE